MYMAIAQLLGIGGSGGNAHYHIARVYEQSIKSWTERVFYEGA